jgi:hypothetical protein
MADLQRVSEKVRSIADMSRPELISEWQAQFGAPAPPKLRAELMRPVLIYRIQESADGLPAPKGKGRIPDTVAANSRRFKTGTRIIREWRGRFTKWPSDRRAMFTVARSTRAYRRSPFGLREPNGRAQPSSAPSPKRVDDGAAVQRAMRHLYP